jgi:uncharacterized OB-fold protein
MTQKPIAEGLFTFPSDDPHLIGSRCLDCGQLAFPKQGACMNCSSVDVEAVELDNRGTLWTFTTQSFRPKDPYIGPEDVDTDWVPFGVGYVDLGGAIRVEGRLTEGDPAKLRIGMEVDLVVIPFGTDDEGDEIVNYAFAPVAS